MTWNNVKPLRPAEAQVELSFILLDIGATPEGVEVDYEAVGEKISAILNGLYLGGWRDMRDTIIAEAGNLLNG